MPDFGRWTPNGGDPSLNEINRTDRFLDALAFEQQVYATDRGEAELINLLSGWRDDIRDAPLTVPVTPRDAVIALDSAQRTRKRSRRTLALVGSTAAAVLCLGGFASVVAGAGPGDSLYGLRTMIFGEQSATRDDAVMLASQQLAEVQQLVDEGQWDAAQQKLQTLTTTVATVNDDVRKQELVTEWQELTVKVDAQDAAAVLPPDAPPPIFPDVPVVVLDTPTPSDNASSETTSPATTPPSDTSTPPVTTSPSETTSPTSPTTPTSPTAPPTSPPVQGPPPSSVPATVEPTSAPSPPPPSQTSEEEPLPTSSVATPPPTTTTTVAIATKTQPAPSSTVSEAAEEAPITAVAPPATVPAPPATVPAPPATVQAPPTTVVAPPPQRQPPPVQRQAPVTTTFVVPEPATGGGGGS
jgi:Anti-sigma-D factor RsdA to sigma factor binding region